MNSILKLVAALGIGALLLTARIGFAQATAKLPPATTRTVAFAKDIEPIFAGHCYSCHGPKKQESSFRLDQKAAALKGGETYGAQAIQAGRSADSILVQAVAHRHAELKMPKKGEPLSAEQVGLLRAWIDQGAVWPESAVAQVADKRKHWAFQTPVRPPLPQSSKFKVQSSNPIDAFVSVRLQRERLKFSPEADKLTLLRRLSLD